MAGAATAVTTAKGLRGVAQDFLAPELCALSERLQGFENLNQERFANVDRQLADLKEDVKKLKRDVKDVREEMKGDLSALNARIDTLQARVDAVPSEIATSIDRLIAALDISNRLAVIERDRSGHTSG